MPTTGLIGLHFVLTRSLCERVSLFGFGSDQDDDSDRPYHYYEGKRSIAAHYADRRSIRSVSSGSDDPGKGRGGAATWPLAVNELMGHDFRLEHKILGTVARRNRTVWRADYVMLMAGQGTAWNALNAFGKKYDPK